MIFRDQMGRGVELKDSPKRIVSLVPSQTELLADLGLGSSVVGITEYCVHPAEWLKTKAIIGGTKRVKINAVKDLKPDLIIANKEENIREQILELEKIAPVWISDVSDLESALEMISGISELCGCADVGSKMTRDILLEFEGLKDTNTARSVLYLIWRKPYMSVGHDTFIHDILVRAGFSNVMQEHTRYPEITGDLASAISPNLIFLSSEPFPFTEQYVPEIQALWPGAEVLLVDGEMFSWYGSRLLQVPAYLNDLLRGAGRSELKNIEF